MVTQVGQNCEAGNLFSTNVKKVDMVGLFVMVGSSLFHSHIIKGKKECLRLFVWTGCSFNDRVCLCRVVRVCVIDKYFELSIFNSLWTSYLMWWKEILQWKNEITVSEEVRTNCCHHLALFCNTYYKTSMWHC